MNGTYSLPSAPPAREANRDIIFMMLPLLVVACYLYGGRPAVMCCVAVATAVVCDHLTAWMRGRTHDSAENSSIPMALVTTMMLPEGGWHEYIKSSKFTKNIWAGRNKSQGS